MKWELMFLAALGTGFGVYSLYLGYDNVVLAGVFGLLGTIAGYVIGKKAPEET